MPWSVSLQGYAGEKTVSAGEPLDQSCTKELFFDPWIWLAKTKWISFAWLLPWRWKGIEWSKIPCLKKPAAESKSGRFDFLKSCSPFWFWATTAWLIRWTKNLDVICRCLELCWGNSAAFIWCSTDPPSWLNLAFSIAGIISWIVMSLANFYGKKPENPAGLCFFALHDNDFPHVRKKVHLHYYALVKMQ